MTLEEPGSGRRANGMAEDVEEGGEKNNLA